MTAVIEQLREAAATRRALTELVEACTEVDPADPNSLDRLDAAIAAGADLLQPDQPSTPEAGDVPAPASPPAGRRRSDSPPVGRAAGGVGEHKRCSECGTDRPLDQYERDARTADRLSKRCIPCGGRTKRTARKKAAAAAGDRDGDKEGSRVAPTATLPRPTRAPAADERTCAQCSKVLPLTSFRRKPTGRSTRCMACDGADNIPANGPDPLPGPIEWHTLVTCPRCAWQSKAQHPHADDRAAVAEQLRRVDQALHDCPVELLVTIVDGSAVDVAGATPTPRPGATSRIYSDGLVA